MLPIACRITKNKLKLYSPNVLIIRPPAAQFNSRCDLGCDQPEKLKVAMTWSGLIYDKPTL